MRRIVSLYAFFIRYWAKRITLPWMKRVQGVPAKSFAIFRRRSSRSIRTGQGASAWFRMPHGARLRGPAFKRGMVLTSSSISPSHRLARSAFDPYIAAPLVINANGQAHADQKACDLQEGISKPPLTSRTNSMVLIFGCRLNWGFAQNHEQSHKSASQAGYYGRMNTNEIRRRLFSLQNQINSLATLLPDHAQINFRIVDCTNQYDVAERKRLVITITEIPANAGMELINRARKKRAK